jgi:hypothetical protein
MVIQAPLASATSNSWSILSNGNVRYVWDEEGNEALVFPDVMRIEALSTKPLSEAVLFGAAIIFDVSDESLSLFSRARRIDLIDPRAEFRAMDPRISKLAWIPGKDGWTYDVSFQALKVNQESVQSSLFTNSSFLGPRISGVTERFKRKVRLAFYELTAGDLEGISADSLSFSGQVDQLVSIISPKVSRQYVPLLIDQFVKRKVVALDVSHPRLLIRDVVPATLEVVSLQEVNEVIAVSGADVKIQVI